MRHARGEQLTVTSFDPTVCCEVADPFQRKWRGSFAATLRGLSVNLLFPSTSPSLGCALNRRNPPVFRCSSVIDGPCRAIAERFHSVSLAGFQMIDSCEKVVIAVTDEEGVPVLVDYLLNQANKGNVPAIVLLHTYIDNSGVSQLCHSEIFPPYRHIRQVSLNFLVAELLPGLLHLYMSTTPQIVDHAINAAIGVAQALDQKEMQVREVWLLQFSDLFSST